MSKAKYRIDRVSIEGFRGFTTPQVVDVGQRNLFLFGANATGKSSIIEAIRWCLFGSPPGREIEVRNTFYDLGPCAVTLVLSADDGQLLVSRELRPGQDRSRPVIQDSAGKTLLLQEALPRLARVGHEQGTQVIFAPQHAVGRQAQVDISDFTRVLHFYLGLESVPELIDRLRKILEERQAEAESLAESIETLAQEYRDRETKLDTTLRTILNVSPWGDGPAPTGADTDAKIRSFVDEQARLHGIQPPKVDGNSALAEAKLWITSPTTKVEERSRLATGLSSLLQQASSAVKELRRATEELENDKAELSEHEVRLTDLLGGETIGDLRNELERRKRSFDERHARVEIALLAQRYLQSNGLTNCHLCDTQVETAFLKEKVESRLAEATKMQAEAQQANALEARLSDAQRESEVIERHKSALLAKTRATLEKVASLCTLLSIEDSDPVIERIDQKIAEVEQDLQNITRQIDDAGAEQARKLKTVRDLEVEISYHECRDELSRVREFLANQLTPAREMLEEYREQLRTTDRIGVILSEALAEAVGKAIPILNDLMTDVYLRLTRQVSYDQVRISKSDEHLTLSVASSRRADVAFPPNVLNGQASKALQLVPYFVFSRFIKEVMELDLLLIDDPSESFDTSHVGSLVAELADAAGHAQLMIATHERDKFEAHLADRFSSDSYRVVCVEGFDPVRGPILASQ